MYTINFTKSFQDRLIINLYKTPDLKWDHLPTNDSMMDDYYYTIAIKGKHHEYRIKLIRSFINYGCIKHINLEVEVYTLTITSDNINYLDIVQIGEHCVLAALFRKVSNEEGIRKKREEIFKNIIEDLF